MEEYESLSLRARRKKPSLSCCFSPGYHRHQRADSFDAPSSSVIPSPTTRLSPSSLKGRCKNLMSRRMGHHRRHSSADFSYDPLSYSLNFQDNDDPSSHHYDDSPVRSFESRLPLSPPASTNLIPPCSTFPKTTATTTPLGGSSSRAAPVAEVRNSLGEEEEEAQMKPWMKLEDMRKLDAPKTPKRKVNAIGAERMNIDMLKPTRMAAVRRSYDYEYQDVSSPTPRQVLLEFC